MGKKMIALIMSLALVVGAFTAVSASASTPVAVGGNNAFEGLTVNNEVKPQWIPLVVVGAKVVAGAAGAGFGAAAGAWAFGKITGNFSVDEALDYEEVSVVFDR
ncbi:hypothetical protein JFL43_20655 [Viridibacillus sp. YIM B01967]|uniref:Uncharacterized protein n=1 Tax=Viridibacillus soli TaxID=2798301 RepID=A0ABS1HCQ9_9BACL|nr:hypothetical protein [Viridibacillus soli]MBK3497194.1 hypothetical protein [Viridibacillus soli]